MILKSFRSPANFNRSFLVKFQELRLWSCFFLGGVFYFLFLIRKLYSRIEFNYEMLLVSLASKLEKYYTKYRQNCFLL